MFLVLALLFKKLGQVPVRGRFHQEMRGLPSATLLVVLLAPNALLAWTPSTHHLLDPSTRARVEGALRALLLAGARRPACAPPDEAVPLVLQAVARDLEV